MFERQSLAVEYHNRYSVHVSTMLPMVMHSQTGEIENKTEKNTHLKSILLASSFCSMIYTMQL